MATDDSDVGLLWVGAGDGAEETGRAHDVERGDAEKAGGVKGSGPLEHGSGDGNGAVDWVGDDEDVSFWRDSGDGLGEVTNNACVGLWK